MTWKEIKSWAKSHGYHALKHEDSYSWSKLEDESICGQAKSVSKLAFAIYNHMTNNKWVEYQEQYKNA
ncbi:hypothetical protein EB001_13655 [bacterium]|jgi:hypothetical protein|nr:hypothetical protein [bacterium]